MPLEDTGKRMAAWFQRFRDLTDGVGHRYAILGVAFLTREAADAGIAKGECLEITDPGLVDSLKYVWETDKQRDINPSELNCVCVVMPIGGM